MSTTHAQGSLTNLAIQIVGHLSIRHMLGVLHLHLRQVHMLNLRQMHRMVRQVHRGHHLVVMRLLWRLVAGRVS